MQFSDLYLTPIVAMPLFVLAVWAGYQYRRVWKTNGATWQLWLFGAIAAMCLCVLGFVPMANG